MTTNWTGKLASDGDRPSPSPSRTAPSGGTPYGRKALEHEADELRSAPEGTRNDRLNTAAFAVGQLVAGGELEERDARDVVLDAAAACGLGRSESAKTFASGFEAGQREPRSAPPKPERPVRSTTSPRNGKANGNASHAGDDELPEPPPGRFDDDGAIVLPDRNGEGSEPAQQSRPQPEIWPALDVAGIFAPLEPINFLCAPLDLCPGAPALVAGYGFSGKTVALQSAGVSIAAGLNVWGTFPARRGRVLHIDYEQGARLTREKYQRLAAGMMVTPDELQGLVLVSLPQVYLDSDTAEGFLVDKCQGFDLAIVDSLRAACPGMEENDSGARIALDMLNRVSSRTGCAVVVVHHARKPHRESAGGAKASIRGSGAIFDACSSVLVFEGEKGRPTRVYHEKARTTGRVLDDFQIRIDDTEVNGAPRGGLVVSAEDMTETTAGHVASKALDAMKERVRAYLREHGDQPGKTALRERLGVNRSTFFAAIAELESDGEIVNVGSERKPRLHLVEVPQ